MAQTCSKCGTTVTNDMPEVLHPLQFLDELRKRGWYIPLTQIGQHPTSGNRPHTCPKCSS